MTVTDGPDIFRRVAVFVACGLLTAAGGASCRSSAPQKSDGRLSVFVSIPPEAYFVQRIGGDHVNVHVLVRPGQNPHTYDPPLKQMAELSHARLFFRIGMPFESSLLPKIADVEGLKIVDLRQGIALAPMAEHEDEEAPAAEHHPPGGMDPHVWLSPKLAKVMARTVGEALAEADPAHAADYRANLQALEADLEALDRRIARALAPVRGRRIYVFHPAFGYFCRAYGLKQEAVEVGGKNPAARQVQALITRARADGVRVIFVQPQFSQRAAETIARRIGGVVVPLDPLAEDYVANLEQMAQKVREALVPPGQE